VMPNPLLPVSYVQTLGFGATLAAVGFENSSDQRAYRTHVRRKSLRMILLGVPPLHSNGVYGQIGCDKEWRLVNLRSGGRRRAIRV